MAGHISDVFPLWFDLIGGGDVLGVSSEKQHMSSTRCLTRATADDSVSFPFVFRTLLFFIPANGGT